MHAFAFNTPYLIADRLCQRLPLPMGEDDRELGSDESLVFEQEPSFLAYQVHLFRCLTPFLEETYSASNDAIGAIPRSRALELADNLDEFRCALPTRLQLSLDPQESTSLHLQTQRVVLGTWWTTLVCRIGH